MEVFSPFIDSAAWWLTVDAALRIYTRVAESALVAAVFCGVFLGVRFLYRREKPGE